MIRSMSPTLASMLQNASGNPNGNMALFGVNGVQAVPQQPAPSPKEMLINGFNSPIMNNYYNPYMGFNNNYNNYGISPFQPQNQYQQNQIQLTPEDLADPRVIATLNAARENHITFEQQLNMQTRIAKKIVECVAAVCDFEEEEKAKMIKACDPPPLPSEIRMKQRNALEIDKPIKPMTVKVYHDGELVSVLNSEDRDVQDYRTKYVSADQLDRMVAAKVINDEKARRINAELYKSSPEKKTDKAENLIDFFNNYGHILSKAYNDYELRKANITSVTQLYNRDEFIKFMKSNGILGYRDVDNPVIGSYSNPVEFKDSPNYKLANQFNRSPNLAGNAIYDPDSDSVTIVAPKFISDRNKRFDGMPNAINSLYENAKRKFIADINR